MTEGALDISLHASVIMNISDHYTRSHIRSNLGRVFGVLLGTQQGPKVEIQSSFEVSTSNDGLLNVSYLEGRKNACMDT